MDCKWLIFIMLQLPGMFVTSPVHAQSSAGIIRGEVTDAETRAPLIGANVVLMDTEMGSATDESGRFVISGVPVGSYSITFRYIGYEPLVKTDVIVKPARTTVVNAELKPSALSSESVTVTAGYFSRAEEEPTSTISFSNEEVRRAPGSAGDVSRILMSLPSVAEVNDQSNQLIVRGGNPMENAFFIDNIEIPNINHFPDAASTGGPIGMVNVDFIEDVTFYTGGFPAQFGDKLSAVMDLDFREGNREEFDAQLDLNFAGFGGVVEGPLFGKKGSAIFSIRRSYLDLVVQTLDVGSTVAPSYGDVQGKVTYDPTPQHRLSMLGLFGDDHNAPDRETGRENKMTHYGNQDIYQGTGGISWRALWNRHGYSNTSLAYTSETFREDFYETSTGMHAIQNHTREQSVKFRNRNHFRLPGRHTLDFGLEAKHLLADYDNYYAGLTNAIGDSMAPVTIADRISADKVGGFLSLTLRPLLRLQFTLGVRTDYFSFNENTTFSPRVAFSYKFTDRTSLNGSGGVYHQNLPLLLLARAPEGPGLSDPRAVHYILGIEHLLTEATRLTLEIYQKEYQHFPLDPVQPGLFIIDEDQFARYGTLTDQGEALSRGLEVTLQKKLARNFYGLASASLFRSRYKGADRIWRDRKYDNRVMFSLEGGYKPNENWEFSIRWIYAGGPPYTPMNPAASRQQHRMVLDETRINEARYPDYHSMNVRFDRRFHFRHSNLIIYVSAWNAYDHKNVATYYWNDDEQKRDVIYQWRILPIFGVEYEF